MNIETNHKRGFTFLELTIILAVIGLLAAVAIPSLVKAHRAARMNAQMHGLHKMDGSKTGEHLHQRQL
jgi:prepilin-type N-terminal cleavage/methylation domain-containing protein